MYCENKTCLKCRSNDEIDRIVEQSVILKENGKLDFEKALEKVIIFAKIAWGRMSESEMQEEFDRAMKIKIKKEDKNHE